MEEIKVNVEKYVRQKYQVDDIKYESKEYFNYVYILEIIYKYAMYNNRHFVEIMPIINKLIIEADKFLELK